MICFSIFYVHTTIFFFRSVQDGQTLTHTLLFMLFCFLTDSITSIQDIGCIDLGECKNVFWKFYLTGYRISSSLAGLKCHHKFWPKRAGNCYVVPPYKDHGPYDPFTSLYQYRNTKSLLSYYILCLACSCYSMSCQQIIQVCGVIMQVSSADTGRAAQCFQEHVCSSPDNCTLDRVLKPLEFQANFNKISLFFVWSFS